MNLNTRKIFIITILVICVIAISLVVFLEIAQKDDLDNSSEEEIIIDTDILTQNFSNIFDNKINYQNTDINIQKEDYTKELVYTNHMNQEKVDGMYEININIPYININNDVCKAINDEINSLFYNKETIDIGEIKNSNNNGIYEVKYKAYINDNILSLIIKSTLKEGDNNSRTIIKTYNYNISSNSKLSINEVLQYRKISQQQAQNKIYETIKVASENKKQYNELRTSKYLRNINHNMYKLENTTVYFIGENKAIYIIYPYGNVNYTSEIDLLVI